MDARRVTRSLLAPMAALLILGASAGAASAQGEHGQVLPRTFGRAQLDLPGFTMVEVGTFGGGLAVLEQRNPEVGPLASRFRMQRRTGVLFGLVAIAGGIVAIDRFADNGRSPLELGDPEANIMIGALGAMTISVIQLEAAGRTLRQLAAGFRGDGSYANR